MDETNIVYEHKDNRKVPVAILSCFLIAFIVQGVLKLCGVFVFEKALDWEIFKIIDNNKTLQVVYYSLLNFIGIYCLSFSLTTKGYSKNWWHYFIILSASFGITSLKMFTTYDIKMQFVYDIISYIIIPLIINFTTNNKYLIIEQKNIRYFITTTAVQILLYFCYLGLNYWSLILNSLIIINQVTLQSSAVFLVYFEMYTGLFLLMLSMNSYIISKKGG